MVMEASEISRFVRNFSVMVRVEGPDPKGIKMRRNACHVHQVGKTSISASGLLLPPSSLTQIPAIVEHILNVHQFRGAVVVSVTSVVEPFLIVEHREKLVQDNLQEFYPRLIQGACIDVLLERKMICNGQQAPESNPDWLPAKLLALVDVPDAADALLSLFGGQSSWEASWSLTTFNAHQPFTLGGFEKKVENDNEFRSGVSLEESSSPDFLAKSITRVSFFGISTPKMKVFEDGLHINISQHQNKGDTMMVMGSPFGVLSPFHFYNSISVGHLANCFTSSSGHSSLLMADIRCLPGMEGGPIFDQHGCLAGILTRPLRQKGSNAEIQFAVTWNAIASIKVESLQPNCQDTQVEFNDRTLGQMGSPYASGDCRSQKCLHMRSVLSAPVNSLENLLSSVVLITMRDGSWASGIVLNNNGLILTNAHILEPWRFKRTSLLRLAEKPTSSPAEHETTLGQQVGDVFEDETGSRLQSKLASSVGGHEEFFFSFNHQSFKRISVRLDSMEQQMWCDAHPVYVSKGSLDIALLQLKSVPTQLSSIKPQLTCPSQGSVVHVIGHGLLGPQSKCRPSISTGILANVVRIPGPLHICGPSKTDINKESMAVMLQTTAAVHPGASGGPVINSNGFMIGLVTSNARHGGGTIMPHLNFSIPCAALEPIFRFSDTGDSSIFQLLDKPNQLLSSVWALVPPPSRKPQPHSESKNHRNEKGSRFSQFLAENAEIASFKKVDHLKKLKLNSKI